MNYYLKFCCGFNGLLLILAAVSTILTACGSSEEKVERPVYLDSKNAPLLKVPDDLNQPEKTRVYIIPELPQHQRKPTEEELEKLVKPPVFITIDMDDLESEELDEADTGLDGP